MSDYGRRPDGSKKGTGFLGELKRSDGSVSTELSISMDDVLGGRDFPLIVPTLSDQEVSHLLSGKRATKSIVDKAVAHAISRDKEGKSVFADDSLPDESGYEIGYRKRK